MGRRVAWVVELDDDTAYDELARAGIATGRFLAHVEDGALPEGFEGAPADMPLHAALRWARTRSAAVILRLVGPDGQPQLFSAGDEEPPWPRSDRPPRWERQKRLVRRRRYHW